MPAHALILAAGRGERMRPLTDTCPKPLLPVQGRPLIEWHLLALASAGHTEVVVNTAWLEAQFPLALGTGGRFGLHLRYSTEGADFGGALETAGGVAHARRWLGDWFWIVAGDVLLPGFDFAPAAVQRFLDGKGFAHLWLVPNPPHHLQGDFSLGSDGRLSDGPGAIGERCTWASVGLFRAELFDGIAPGGHAKLRPLLDRAMAADRLSGEWLATPWVDVGTPERLAAAQGVAA
jgi:MurNAc alpha-1-phosphate uridylyltransferase